jgi:hypothetical protein
MTEVQKSVNCDLCGFFNQFIVSCRAGIYTLSTFTRRLHLTQLYTVKYSSEELQYFYLLMILMTLMSIV